MEWISVEDRLPEEGHQVLCFGYDGDLPDQFTGELNKGYCPVTGHFEYVEMYNGSVATHWMPLPEPPK